MRSIKLTCEQRRVLLAMRELYLRNMGALVRRRQQLSAELQVGVCIGMRPADALGVWPICGLQQPCLTPGRPSSLMSSAQTFPLLFLRTHCVPVQYVAYLACFHDGLAV